MRERFDVLKRAVKAMSSDHMTSVAAALAYYGFLAIPSVLLIAIGVFGVVAGPDSVDSVVSHVSNVVPEEVQTLLHQSLTRMTESHGTGWAAIGIGTVIALWSLTGAAVNVIWGLNLAFGLEEHRGYARKRLAALSMIGYAALGFGLCLGVIVLGPQISGWIGNAVDERDAVTTAWSIAQWPLIVAALLVVFSGILRVGPDMESGRRRIVTTGSVLAVLVWVVASLGFSIFANHFGSYNKAWGSLSAVVVMLTWLWLSSLALLFGAEIDAETGARTRVE